MTVCLQFIDLAMCSTVKSEKLPESRGSCYTKRTTCRGSRIQVSRDVTLCFCVLSGASKHRGVFVFRD